MLVNDGVISRSLMEIAGLNVGSYVVSKLFGDDESRSVRRHRRTRK